MLDTIASLAVSQSMSTTQPLINESGRRRAAASSHHHHTLSYPRPPAPPLVVPVASICGSTPLQGGIAGLVCASWLLGCTIADCHGASCILDGAGGTHGAIRAVRRAQAWTVPTTMLSCACGLSRHRSRSQLCAFCGIRVQRAIPKRHFPLDVPAQLTRPSACRPPTAALLNLPHLLR